MTIWNRLIPNRWPKTQWGMQYLYAYGWARDQTPRHILDNGLDRDRKERALLVIHELVKLRNGEGK